MCIILSRSLPPSGWVWTAAPPEAMPSSWLHNLCGGTSAERMLTAVYEEPLLEPVAPRRRGSWSIRTRGSGGVYADCLTAGTVICSSWAPVAVPNGQVSLAHRARQLLWHLGCPLAIAPRGKGRRDKAANSSESASDSTTVPEPRAALKLAGLAAVAASAELEVRGAVDEIESLAD